MITFEMCCVCVVIILLIAVITALSGFVMVDDYDSFYLAGWILSSIGFGICLTILLYQNGVLK